jgi:WD40 repeat protein
LHIPTPSLVWSVAYAHNGVIVAGCEDGTIRRFDAASGEPGWTLQLQPSGAILSLSASLDGRWVAAAGGMLGVFDLVDGTPRFAPIALDKMTWARFSPTLRQLVTGWDCLIPPEELPSAPPQPARGLTVLNARTGRQERRSDPAVDDFAISPDGAYVAAKGNGFVEVYDLASTISRYEVGQDLTAIKVSPAGTPLVAVADKSPAVTVIPAVGGNPLAHQTISGSIVDMVFADGGSSVAVGSPTGVRLFSILGVAGWTKNIGGLNAIAVTGPAGEWSATAAGRNVDLLSSATGDPRWPSCVHPKPVRLVAGSDDGKWIATACTDKRTRIIDAHTGSETYQTDPPANELTRALVFQPGGSLLATGNTDGSITLIDPTAASPVRGEVKRNFGCTGLAFSFDATMLAAAWDDNTVFVYDITTNGDPTPLREFRFPAPVTALGFNPADNTVAIATAAVSISTYDARTGVAFAPILHPQAVRQFAFSADGALIATACDDGTVRVFASGPS